MENKIKHLEFIQQIISRMNTNSFLLKGWSVTIMAGLFALAAKDSNQHFILITYFPILVFGILDAYFLSQERQYRALYNKVRLMSEESIDFDMQTNGLNEGKNHIANAFISSTIAIFYLSLLAITTLVIIL
ncbi:hypothetical protein COR50_17375 [Chitinophaga caeni]|uniref:Uncharacterized protein n=1 Tax=Chitinophaga caeni TaxID=2029983 RepID=A0A291QY00_9BACT|nr:hypothetical protein [Chitinophaga caeni]ATL48791.1 hypothetical protein COR50_17375 [Chitinophaga caeni]